MEENVQLGPQILQSDTPQWNGIETHLQSLWDRAKRERQPRTEKWLRNLATQRGECVGIGGQGGDAAKIDTDGGWQAGKAVNGGERIRIAKQKIVAAKDIVGDSVYKANTVPFLLRWRVGSAASQQDNADDVLASLTEAVKELLKDTNTADQMRKAVEDGASFGEYWIKGTDGLAGTIIDNPTPWEMYIDAFSEEDVESAEYVIRDQRVTPFIALNIASGAPDIFDAGILGAALHGATPSGAEDAGQENPAVRQRTGRYVANTVSWREVWAYIPNKLFEDKYSLPEGFDTAQELGDDLRGFTPVWAIMCDGRMVSCVVEPGARPYAHFFWQRNRMEEMPEGINDELECVQTMMTGMLRSKLENMRNGSHITLAGHPDLLRKDPVEIMNGVKFIPLDPDCRDVSQAIQQFRIDPVDGDLTQMLQTAIEYADMESAIPRVLQGMQPNQGQTAFEIRNRLSSAGKHLGEAVRLHDKAIVWVVRYALGILGETMMVPPETMMEIEPSGFSAYSDLVTRLDALVAALQYTKMNPAVDMATRSVDIVRAIGQANDLDILKFYKSDAEIMAEQQAQSEQQAQQMQMQQAQMEIDNEVKRAKAARDQANAESLAGKNKLERAKFVRDLENAELAQAQAAAMENSQQ